MNVIRHHDPSEKFEELKLSLSVIERFNNEIGNWRLFQPERAGCPGVQFLFDLKKLASYVSR